MKRYSLLISNIAMLLFVTVSLQGAKAGKKKMATLKPAMQAEQKVSPQEAHTKLASILKEKAQHHTELAKLSTEQAEYSLMPSHKKMASIDAQLHTALADLHKTLSKIHSDLAEPGPHSKEVTADLRKQHEQLRRDEAKVHALHRKMAMAAHKTKRQGRHLRHKMGKRKIMGLHNAQQETA